MESVAQFVAQNAKRENHLAAISLHTIDFTREFGGRTWARTKDPLIKSQLLYQLSYAPIDTEAEMVKPLPSAAPQDIASCDC